TGRGAASFRDTTNWATEQDAYRPMKRLDRVHEGRQTGRMKNSSNPPTREQTREARQKKLAEALRANLRRRKSSGTTRKPGARGNS
ncbi:MAG: hypothetical protein VYC90_04800, partial [Pseudomonadota bacterium]|nr:hypothetical protein [Pseudomonadota bacterium]